MEKLLPILAIVKFQGVPPSSVELRPFLYPLQCQEHGKATDGRAGTRAGSATLRSLENTYLEGPNQVPQEYLYEKPLQRCQDIGFAGHDSIWGQRGKLSSPYSCFGEHQRCFYYSYKSMIISISVWSDLPETTLGLFFSRIFCKICSGHAGVPGVDDTQMRSHGITRAY